MADFGFNPGIILTRAPHNSGETLSDALNGASERQLRQLQAQEMQYQMGRQRSLADLVSQNANVYTDPAARSYAMGGFADQAAAAQNAAALRQQRMLELQETAAKVDNIHRDLTASRLAGVKSQEDFDKIASSVPEEYGLKPGDANWQDAVKTFRQSRISPEQQAENDNRAAQRTQEQEKIDQGNWETVKDMMGNPTALVNKKTREVVPFRRGAVSGAPSALPGAPAPVNPLYGLKPKDINEQFNKMHDDLSDNNTRKLLGQNAQSLQRAEGLEQLLNVPDLNTITPQQVREAGTTLAGLIAKGGPQAISQIDELVPQSLASKWAGVKQELLNQPEGANAKAFLQNMLDTAAREKKLTLSQQQRIREEALGNYAYLRNANPARYDSILSGVGLNPAAYDANGRPKKTGGLAAHPQDDAAVTWAKANPNDPRAAAILKANGVQ